MVVGSIEATAPAKVAITADRFRRIPIGTLLRLAVDPFPAVAAVAANVAPDPARFRAYSPAHLAAVVAVYRAAVGQGAPPSEAIANHFGVQRVTVDRWLKRARNQGLLGPWAQERAREIRPPGGWPKTTGRNRRGSHA